MAGVARVYTFAEFAVVAASGGLVPPPATPLPPAVGRVVGQILVSDIRQRFATGTAPDGTRWRPLKYPRPNGGNHPLRDTGALAASFTARADATGVTVGTTHPGAALQNAGGTVVPRRGKFLAVPLTREAKRAGSPRRMRGDDRTPLFARKVGGRMVGHFLLVRKAVVPARPFLGVSRTASEQVGRVLLEAAARGWVESR